MGQELVVDGFPTSPHSIQIPHPHRQSLSTYEAILWDHPQQKHALDDVWSSEESLWTCLAPKFQWQHASRGHVLMAAWVRPTRPAIALCPIPSLASASTPCPIPIVEGGGIISAINAYWKNMQLLFDLATVWSQIWGNDNLSCGLEFDNRTWHWSLAKVWSDVIVEQSQLHFMSISAHWKHKN